MGVVTPADLHAWRTRLGLSQAAAAEALGISRSQYIRYETGRSRDTRAGRKAKVEIPRLVELATRVLDRDFEASTIEALVDHHIARIKRISADSIATVAREGGIP